MSATGFACSCPPWTFSEDSSISERSTPRPRHSGALVAGLKSGKGDFSMNKRASLWIDHRKAVIVILSEEGEPVHVIASHMEKHGRFAGRTGSADGSTSEDE